MVFYKNRFIDAWSAAEASTASAVFCCLRGGEMVFGVISVDNPEGGLAEFRSDPAVSQAVQIFGGGKWLVELPLEPDEVDPASIDPEEEDELPNRVVLPWGSASVWYFFQGYTFWSNVEESRAASRKKQLERQGMDVVELSEPFDIFGRPLASSNLVAIWTRQRKA